MPVSSFDEALAFLKQSGLEAEYFVDERDNQRYLVGGLKRHFEMPRASHSPFNYDWYFVVGEYIESPQSDVQYVVQAVQSLSVWYPWDSLEEAVKDVTGCYEFYIGVARDIDL